MVLRKRDGSPYWNLDIAVPLDLQPIHGPRIRSSTGTADKKLAQQLHDKVRADLWRQDKLEELAELTLSDAVDRWRRHAKVNKIRSADSIEFRLEWWIDKLGGARSVRSIKRQEILKAVDGKMTIPRNAKEVSRPASPATINQYLKAMRMLLGLCAKEWDAIEAAPSIKLLPGEAERVRALTKEQLLALLRELPEHWRCPFILAACTGLRKSNVIELTWAQVDLKRRRLLVGSEDFKNGTDFGLPLNDTALVILEECLGKHEIRVFTYEGRPLQTLVHRTWRKALERAGIEDFRWHDLRHTWATLFLESGGEIDDLQKLGGWKSRAMVLRYAHYRTEHMRKSATLIDKDLGELIGNRNQVTPG